MKVIIAANYRRARQHAKQLKVVGGWRYAFRPDDLRGVRHADIIVEPGWAEGRPENVVRAFADLIRERKALTS